MSRLFYHVMQDNVGNLLFDVSGTMRLAGSGTLATIYGDEALTVILPNPMTNHPSFGSFKCFLGAGDYDFYLAKSGYTFETLTGVQGSGTMADQNANAVAITGGTITGLGLLSVQGDAHLMGHVGVGIGASPSYGLLAAGASRFQNTVQVIDQVAFGENFSPSGLARIHMDFLRGATGALSFRPTDGDAGSAATVLFFNNASGVVGSISQTGAATSFNTSSDARLKHAIVPLTGALGVVRALKPVHFLWNANDEPGEGFLAHELMRHVPAAVTGEPDAVNEDGSVKPQQVDHSTLVPWLVAACQALAEQVAALVGVAQDAHELMQALASRVAALEGATP